jgi:hypothetical protein
MVTLNAKKLRQALRKAQQVGRVEEAVKIDGCGLVFQNLAQHDYDQILEEIEGLEGAEYMHALQMGHICRSVVEIEGVDLREVKYVEDDVPMGEWLLTATFRTESTGRKAVELLKQAKIAAQLKEPDTQQQLNMERHEWVRHQLSSWGREAIYVAWRKFTEVLATSEERAKEGVQFNRDDEAPEDKYRRLLREAKELEESLPPDLAQKVADDVGYLLKSSEEERAAAAERVREFRQQQQDQSAVEAVEEEEENVERPAPAPPPQPKLDPELLMRNRQPLNRQPISAPVPMATQENVTPAVATLPVAPEIRAAAVNLQQRTTERAAEIARLEALEIDPAPAPVPPAPVQREVAELSHAPAISDPRAVLGIIEQPPVGGLNPRYNPPNRQR